MRILAVDPGRKSGYAIVEDGKVLECGAVRGEYEHMIALLEKIKQPIDIVAVEDQFIIFRKGLISLVRKASYWMSLARYILKPSHFFFIPPAKWRVYFNIRGRGGHERYIKTAKLVGKIDPPTEDAAVAVLIGLYIWNTEARSIKDGKRNV